MATSDHAMVARCRLADGNRTARGSSRCNARRARRDLTGVVGAMRVESPETVEEEQFGEHIGQQIGSALGRSSAAKRPQRGAEHQCHETCRHLEHQHDDADRTERRRRDPPPEPQRPCDESRDAREAAHPSSRDDHSAAPCCLPPHSTSNIGGETARLEGPETASLPLLWVQRNVNARRPTEH